MYVCDDVGDLIRSDFYDMVFAINLLRFLVFLHVDYDHDHVNVLVHVHDHDRVLLHVHDYDCDYDLPQII